MGEGFAPYTLQNNSHMTAGLKFKDFRFLLIGSVKRHQTACDNERKGKGKGKGKSKGKGKGDTNAPRRKLSRTLATHSY